MPLVWGAVSQYGGQRRSSPGPTRPGYRDLFPVPPDDVRRELRGRRGAADDGRGDRLDHGDGGAQARHRRRRAARRTGHHLRRADREVPRARATSAPSSSTASPFDGTGLGDAPPAVITPVPIVHESDRHDPPCISNGGRFTTGSMPSPREPESVLPAEFAARPTATLLDVRETWEAEIASLPGAARSARHTRQPDLDAEPRPGRARGRRTAITASAREQARRMLAEHGFTVRHLEGGIDAWPREIDPSMARY